MPNVALFPAGAPNIDVLTGVVDGYPREVHRLDIATGKEPLEDGLHVTDHAVPREEKLTLTGWVSSFVSTRAAASEAGNTTPSRAWTVLRRLNREVRPIKVATEWGVYGEMLIASAEATKDSPGMEFTLDLVQIIVIGVDPLANTDPNGPARRRTSENVRGVLDLDVDEFNALNLEPDVLEGLDDVLSTVEDSVPSGLSKLKGIGERLAAGGEQYRTRLRDALARHGLNERDVGTLLDLARGTAQPSSLGSITRRSLDDLLRGIDGLPNDVSLGRYVDEVVREAERLASGG